MIRRGSESPWGKVQDSKVLADGITWVSTAGHGGFLLSPARQLEVAAVFPGHVPYAGRGAFEEDQDWAIIALVFPDLFKPMDIFNAVRTVDISVKLCAELYPNEADSGGWKSVQTWLRGDDPRATKLRAIASEYARSVSGQWESGGCSAPVPGYPPTCWRVPLTRGAETKTVVFGAYPKKQYYTDDEISALTAAPIIEPPSASAPRGKILGLPIERDIAGVLGADGNCYSDSDPGL